MPYNSGSTEWANRAQVIEQQMENLLGTDYIDVVIDATTNKLLIELEDLVICFPRV